MANKIEEPLLYVPTHNEEMAQAKKNLQLFTNENNNMMNAKKKEFSDDNHQTKFQSLEVENPGTSSPTTGTLIADSRSPLEAYCIDCKKNIITVVTFHTGRNTQIMGGLLCCLGFYCCCCCLPYHMNDCKDVRHRCPSCDGLITIKKFTIF